MGSGGDYNDVDRFLRSTEGKEYFRNMWKNLVGEEIDIISLQNGTDQVLIHLRLTNGEEYTLTDPQMDIAVLQTDFAEAIAREKAKEETT